MNNINVIALYETLAKIFELKEDCKINVKILEKENEKNTSISQA